MAIYETGPDGRIKSYLSLEEYASERVFFRVEDNVMNRDQEFNAMMQSFTADCDRNNTEMIADSLPFMVAAVALAEAFGPSLFLILFFIVPIVVVIKSCMEFKAILKQNDRDWEAFKRKHYGIFSK